MSTIQVPVFDAPVIRKPSLPIEKDTNLPDENDLEDDVFISSSNTNIANSVPLEIGTIEADANDLQVEQSDTTNQSPIVVNEVENVIVDEVIQVEEQELTVVGDAEVPVSQPEIFTVQHTVEQTPVVNETNTVIEDIKEPSPLPEPTPEPEQIVLLSPIPVKTPSPPLIQQQVITPTISEVTTKKSSVEKKVISPSPPPPPQSKKPSTTISQIEIHRLKQSSSSSSSSAASRRSKLSSVSFVQSGISFTGERLISPSGGSAKALLPSHITVPCAPGSRHILKLQSLNNEYQAYPFEQLNVIKHQMRFNLPVTIDVPLPYGSTILIKDEIDEYGLLNLKFKAFVP